MHRLITIPMSHYNERARWALDVCHVLYQEEPYLPLLHFPPVIRNTFGRGKSRGDRASSAFSTPLLIMPNGRRIHDSGEIVRYAAARFPNAIDVSDAAFERAQEFHDRLGPAVRRIVYFWCLPQRELMQWIARENVDPWQARALSLVYPLFRRAMVRALGVTEARSARALDRVRETFEQVSGEIAGRAFLVGDRFSVADLTFASLAALGLGVTRREGYGAVMPSMDQCPAAAREVMAELRATEAGKFVLRMYAQQRRPRR